MFSHLRIHIIYLCACIAFLLCTGFCPCSTFSDHVSNHGKSPDAFLVEKAASHRLLLLGTRHDNELMHALILDILPVLVKESGINTLFVEIPSNQQSFIEMFKRGECHVENISIHKIIATSAYLKVITRAKELGMNIIAIDNNENEKISRDQWMASHVSDYLRLHLDAKGLVIVGNRHVFKNIQWTYGEYPSLADYLAHLRPYSVVIWPDGIRLSHPVAIDINNQSFLGMKDPTLMSMNILPQTCLATSADGVIFLSE
jgi:hypothetical protein